MKKIGKFFPLIVLSLILTSCNGKPFDSEDFINKLFPNVWDALATFLAFIVLLLVAFFFAYKPIKNLIKKRGDYVEGKIKDAEKREKDADNKIKIAQDQISQSRQEAIEIVEKAKEDALIEKANIKNQAKIDADKEIERAKMEIAQEISKSKDNIHHEIVDVALKASSKVLEREINDKDNEKLIDDFIDNLEK